MPAAAERMSRVDTAWLRMDNDVNLMMIVGVWLLTPAITLEVLRRRVAERLLVHSRFRDRAVADAAGASWVADDALDIAHHVVAAPLRPAAGQSERQALQQLCGELAMTPLDPAHPLWQFHFIDRYEGGSALVARIHHCIGDGLSLVAVMLSLTDDGGGAPPPGLTASGGVAGRRSAPPRSGLFDGLRDGMAGGLGIARTGLKVAGDAAALGLMADDSPTLLKGRPAGRKLVAWSEPLALDRVKAIGKGLACSVNDVLLSCAAGALGGHLRRRGQDPAGKEIRALVPVNLRPPGQARELGNRFGLAPLVLPVGIGNPVQRLESIHKRMDELKDSFQPLLSYAVLGASGLFVKPVQDAVLGLFSSKATAVMTNVPGPALPLRFCGSTLRQNLFWVPASGDIGVGLSIFSYGGGVQFGLITDAALCPDPQDIVDRFEPELDKLEWLTLMLPWPGQCAARAQR